MLVQVDGWSGSGKSVLMYLLDGHPNIYSHPFHDVIQFLFRKENWDEEWVRVKDIRELRTRLALFTEYFRTESFIRQGKYILEFSKDKHLSYSLPFSFDAIDSSIIRTISKLQCWSPEQLINNFYQCFYQHIFQTTNHVKHIAIMGGWKDLDNFNVFSTLILTQNGFLLEEILKMLLL
ncbi:MAG: hypothetical protein HC819_18485 [Cyclobacteriaceae bacterium]|nr:hypothetical protein [Cyclobacteriaceae bacterium]